MAIASRTAAEAVKFSFSKLKTNFASLKKAQEEASIALLEGNDVFVRLPTGFGKTIITVLLPFAFDYLRDPGSHAHSVILCVSPLSALMADQKRRIEEMGLKVELLGRGQTDPSAFAKVRAGQFQVVLLSPELLLENEEVREALQSGFLEDNIRALVVDEAHCIVNWGEGFRPAFSKLGEIRSLLKPDVHILAMTATAETRTKLCITAKLQLKPPIYIEQSPDRPSIFYGMLKGMPLADLSRQMVEGLREHGDKYPKTLVFCRKCEDCGKLYVMLRDALKDKFTSPPGIIKNIPGKRLAEIFMSENTEDLKKKIIENFVNKDTATRVIICTEAFGMGLDCPNIRQVIHYGYPPTVESYIQETGRAARDGNQSRAILINQAASHTSKDMLGYRHKNSCSRKYLFEICLGVPYIITETPCRCCSYCAELCRCDQCVKLNCII